MQTPDYLSEKTKLSLHKLPAYIKNWIVVALLLLISLLISLAFLVRFPEKISGEVSFKNTTPDIPIVSKKEGRLRLKVKNQEHVRRGQILGYLETAANIGDIFWLDSLFIEHEEDSGSHSLKGLHSKIGAIEKTEVSLGALQVGYERLVKRLKDFQYLNQDNNLLTRIENLKNQRGKIENKINSLKARKIISKEELQLASKNFETDKTLHQQEVISDYDFNNRQKNYLAAKKELQTINFSIAENQELLDKLNYQILELKSGHHRNLFDLEQLILSDIALLKTEIKEWKDQNVFYSSAVGIINFALNTEDGKFIDAEEPVCYLVPSSQDRIVGNLKVSSIQVGEIAHGQKVIVKLDSYPYEKYGVLFSKVSLISEKQEGNQLLIEVNMGQSLVSSTGYEFNFIQDMTGIGEIIIAEESLAQKVLKTINQLKFQ